jgi:hypothetical protein
MATFWRRMGVMMNDFITSTHGRKSLWETIRPIFGAMLKQHSKGARIIFGRRINASSPTSSTTSETASVK